jgi:Dissimilatory sulfite reductase (desulfoviridin), alpha and beta subunits
MRFTTFYFSGTGNTEWAVRKFSQFLNDAGHDAKMYSVDSVDVCDTSLLEEIVHKSDYTGFANPIYGGNIPPIMKNFIHNIAKVLENKEKNTIQTYFINTFAYINGFGPICTKKLLYDTPFKLISYVNIRLCNNISKPGLKSSGISDDILKVRKDKAEKELKKMVGKLLSGEKYITGIGPYLIPNIFIRKKTEKLIADNYKALSIDESTCRKCLLCVRNCPTKSIKYSENGFKFTPGCTACMRCYNLCPTFSVLFNGKFADPNEYQRYYGPETKKE